MHNDGAWSNYNKGMKGKRSLVAMYGKQGVLVGPGIFSAFIFFSLSWVVGRELMVGFFFVSICSLFHTCAIVLLCWTVLWIGHLLAIYHLVGKAAFSGFV
jgi:hypothetical protein